MSYILVSESGRPVPLPFHTVDQVGDAIRITDFRLTPDGEEVYVMDETGLWETLDGWSPAEDYRLRIIAEAEYMEKQ